MKVDRQPRLVIDTNVWISAALSAGGPPARLVRQVLQHGLPVFSAATFDALQTRLWKPKFDRWISMDDRRRLLHDLNACAIWVVVPADLAARRFSCDPDDDAFVHAAWAAGAGWLVSGDQDLLTITEPLPMRILTPAAALTDTDLANALR